MDFNHIIGHEKVIEVLKRALENNTISHSYLFEGEEGLGKKRVAFAFAKALLCIEEQSQPCNTCSSCLKFQGGNHPDFFLIDSEKGLIKKEEIESLIKNITRAPFESERKIFIIDDSDKMNSQGKNALLKTLEEPPSYVNIILISSNTNHLLPTILSRVQRIKFYPVEATKIVKHLVDEYGKFQEEAGFIAEFSKGSVGKSIDLSSSEDFFKKRDEIIKIIDSLLKGDKTKVFSSMEFFNDNKEEIEELLDIFLFWFRDLVIYKEIGESQLIINKDKLEYLSSQSFMKFNKIHDIINKIQETKEDIGRNVNYQLSIETMLLNIQEE